jgi:hypothetical protein
MKVYLVEGEWGEYSDHSEWHVATYSTKELAEKHKELALEWIKQEGEQWGVLRKENPYDKGGWASTYKDTEYHIYEMEVLDAVESADPVT